MANDYKIETYIVIKYVNKRFEFKTIKIDHTINRCNVSLFLFKNRNPEVDITNNNKPLDINSFINDYTYNTYLYNSGEWLKTSFKSDYEGRIKRDYPDIYKLFEVYKISKIVKK